MQRHSRNTADLPVLPLQAGERKQQWVYRQIVSAIEAGLLGPGASVPSTRTLAARWGVSRGVVELAFEQLNQEGYLQSMAGKGSRIADPLPDGFLRASVATPLADPASSWLDARASHAATAPGLLPARQAFIARLPDIEGFDLKGWRDCVSRAARHLEPSVMGDTDPRGLLPLREEICKHLAVSRAIRCSREQVIVVTGVRHAIDLVAQLSAPGAGTVALEDPGYAGAAAIFQLHNRKIVSIPVDDQGIDVSQLNRSDASLAYVTPAHQAPTGVVMSSTRREELLAWASARNAWIFEDDYDSDFNYELAPPPALKSRDTAERVIFCGSFNKSLFPGLRVGYIVVPSALAASLSYVRAITGRANSVQDQLALVEFMRSGAFLRHLKRTRQTYKERRELVLDELRASGWRDEDFQGTHAGFHFVLRLHSKVEEDIACALAAEAGIAVQGVSALCRTQDAPPNAGLVIGYTALSDSQAKWSARTLAAALERLRG
jgi:GntR family transcriptional regulator / MocR family aminotransferase